MESQTCGKDWQSHFLYEQIMATKDEIAEFSTKIQELVNETRMGYMDSIVHYCEQTGMEINVASTLISSAMKSKIREEAQDLNLLKRSSKLPL